MSAIESIDLQAGQCTGCDLRTFDAQYGDFTFSAERLLEEVVEAAIRSRN